MSETEPIIASLSHVVGQQRAVRVLKTALDAYWNERSKSGAEDAFPHLLIVGPSGTGKTTLTELIARELCTQRKRLGNPFLPMWIVLVPV